MLVRIAERRACVHVSTYAPLAHLIHHLTLNSTKWPAGHLEVLNIQSREFPHQGMVPLPKSTTNSQIVLAKSIGYFKKKPPRGVWQVNRKPYYQFESEIRMCYPSTKDIQPPVIQKSHDPVKPVSSPISPEPSSAQVDNSPPSKEPSKETRLPYPSRVEHEKKGLTALQFTGCPIELEIASLCVPKGIARDVLVPVGRFTFPADFVVVDLECNYQVPLILGRPFLRTARVLIDVHGEELVIRDGMERIVLIQSCSQAKESII
ncbi:reverse transcriptase domain-containing protein [Tanacetum coccineum]